MIPHNPENSRQATWGIAVLVITLIASLWSAGFGYLEFYLYTHGNTDRAVALVADLYGQSRVGVPTFGWYALMVGLLALTWRWTKEMHDFRRMMWRVGMVAILLPPNIYINPPPSFGAALADPQNWGPQPDIIVLPAIVCVAQYVLYLAFQFAALFPVESAIELFAPLFPAVSAMQLSILPIPVVWFIVLFIAVVHRAAFAAKT